MVVDMCRICTYILKARRTKVLDSDDGNNNVKSSTILKIIKRSVYKGHVNPSCNATCR